MDSVNQNANNAAGLQGAEKCAPAACDDMLELSCYDFMERLASSAPVPGGGGASAFCGALAMCLGRMVGELTVGKPKYVDVWDDIKMLLDRAEDLQARLCDAVARDAEAFEPLSKAYGIPKGEPGRDELMEKCLRQAAAVPMDIAVLCCEGMDVLKEFSLKGSKLVISDAATAAVFCKAALQGAALNVRVNTALMKDREYAERLNSKLSDISRRGCALADEIYGDVTARVG